MIELLLALDRAAAILTRRLDAGLGGLGWKEFIILHHLETAGQDGMRRVDLAELVGLTPSGITRLLLPMEKVGYVKKETNADDARVSLVRIAPGGQRRLEEARERLGYFCDEILPTAKARELRPHSEFLKELGNSI